jgi:hypothetical protein
MNRKKMADTSLEANDSVTHAMRIAHCKRILCTLWIIGKGNYDDICIAGGFQEPNQVSRRLKLCRELGWVETTKEKTMTSRNRLAYVHIPLINFEVASTPTLPIIDISKTKTVSLSNSNATTNQISLFS